MLAGIGRFGPYIRYGNKFVSLKEDDPHEVPLSRALELIVAKKQADLDRILKTFPDSEVQILKGRWGPFITDGKKNARMSKDREPASMTLAECQEALAAVPDKKSKKTSKKTAKKAAEPGEAAEAGAATKKTATKKKTAKKKTAKRKSSKKKAPKKTGAKKKVTQTADGSQLANPATATEVVK